MIFSIVDPPLRVLAFGFAWQCSSSVCLKFVVYLFESSCPLLCTVEQMVLAPLFRQDEAEEERSTLRRGGSGNGSGSIMANRKDFLEEDLDEDYFRIEDKEAEVGVCVMLMVSSRSLGCRYRVLLMLSTEGQGTLTLCSLEMFIAALSCFVSSHFCMCSLSALLVF